MKTIRSFRLEVAKLKQPNIIFLIVPNVKREALVVFNRQAKI